MLRTVVLDQGGSCEHVLSLIKFTYTNSFQATIGMTPYEALYGKKCKSPFYWDEVGERRILGPNVVGKMLELVKKIRKGIQEAKTDSNLMLIRVKQSYILKSSR